MTHTMKVVQVPGSLRVYNERVVKVDYRVTLLENGREVIDVILGGFAKCSNHDTFDVKVGVSVARAKVIQEFSKKVEDSFKELRKTMDAVIVSEKSTLNALSKFEEQAQKALDEANNKK